MPRDYAPSKTQRTKRTASPRGADNRRGLLFGSFAGGLVCGAVLAFVFGPAIRSAIDGAVVAEQPPTTAPERPVVTYEFPNRLASDEVVVNVDAYEPPPRVVDEPAEYLLQAAAFRNLDDAHGMRAQLLLENMDAAIDTGAGADGGIWHRVLVGPFADKQALEEARKSLHAKDIPAVVLRTRRSASP